MRIQQTYSTDQSEHVLIIPLTYDDMFCSQKQQVDGDIDVFMMIKTQTG